MRAVSTVLIAAGLLLLADAGVTLLWQEPLSALYASREQRRLDDQLGTLTRVLAQDPIAEAGTVAGRRRARARALRRRLRAGRAVGRLEARDAGVDAVVVEGTAAADLRDGPGHYSDTGLPGEGRTIAVAGHRTTYGAHFRDIDDLERGDRIRFDLPYGRFDYAVSGTRVVEPTATSVLRNTGRERLVLTACHPRYSAAKRIVVSARLVDIRMKHRPRP